MLSIGQGSQRNVALNRPKFFNKNQPGLAAAS
jgi:hypothetical protein